MENNSNNAPQLPLNDLELTVELIDLCSARGAFRGTELTLVGGLRDRLAAFLAAAKAAAEQTQAPATDAPAAETAAAPTETA